MKVMQVLPTLEVGGVERGVIDLARAMKRLGHETVVVSAGGPLVAELKRLGVPHYELAVHRKSLWTLRLVPRLAEIIRKERVDVVHARSRVPAWISWLAARQASVPFVTTCHGYYSKHLLSRVMGWGKRVIVISRIIGRHMIDHFGVSADKIRLIHRGVDLQQFSAGPVSVRGRRKTGDEVFRIINVGRFSPIKGQVEFLRAVHLLRRRVPSLEVLLAGSEGRGKHKYTETIRRTVEQLGLESCVQLLGTRRDIPELLGRCDLLVLSTLVPEAFGRVLIEAGAVGVPVLSTHVGGVLDILEDGVNGSLVPAGDVDAMAEAMLVLWRDPEKAARMARALQEKVVSQFSLDEMAERNVAVYEEVRRLRKILVIKLGAMGDVILVTPSLRMLRQRFPEACLCLLTDKKNASAVSGSPYVNEIFPVDRRKMRNPLYLLKLAKKLRQEEFDVSVDFQNSKWTHLLAFAGGVTQRYGFKRGPLGFLLNRPDQGFDVKEPPVKHQFRILSKLGVRELDDRLELSPDPESEERMETALEIFRAVPGAKKIGLVMGSSPQWPAKRWPREHFEALAGRLIRELRACLVLIGSPGEEGLSEEWRKAHEGRVLDLIGQTSPQDLISLAKRLDLVVTGDTAPLHVAAAMQTKIIAFFGPTDPGRHMPAAFGAVVLSRRLACQPCYSGECKASDKLACLRQISVSEVFETARRLLGSPS
ncbi:MAG: glycosyltransferase [Candidatus Omnitrophota bacterium]|jgi:lipopolysaccharide heptosyltransferase II